MNRRLVGVAAGLALIVLVAVAVAAANPALLITGYETTTVEAVDGETGESLATVEARVADGFVKRYVGLSATEELAEDEGMLFVHDDAAERAYVMREMAFGLDIVFVAPNGTVTTIHGAEPESAPLTRYRGTGRYVLEVPRGWSERHGVEPGDQIVFDCG
ncbi:MULTISPECIES: DUF192 domain-containing protein [unclassified Halorubrum]|uniref:DUF192 domain-containing protein n=1 Tax=unclassified Halorubrum TaxID=2642239 RepID=UPI000B989C19|nr:MULTISPECIES: DUF192 domain-containing protein [unclassified Halorubrum]OYR39562.1 hypothetical protein DJ81_16040 [Halorubrum sp. Hd13]OYR40990.1 hypothetical protein DJ75_14525 [Halorubrum sp. Eb13]OYR49702.1 hypothetical protein DJ74_07830 [Halorubrum sp. Ea8]OYR51509.1 hypothetical protein DJ73_12995 [Halorubrum sp. Ea1]